MSLPVLMIQQPPHEPLRTGEYRVRVADLAMVESPFQEGREQVKLTLEVLDPPYSGRRLTAYCSLSASPKAKLVRWAQALLNRPLTAGDSLNLADLIGREGIAVVILGRGSRGDYNRVEDLLPVPVQATTAPQPVQEATDPFAQ